MAEKKRNSNIDLLRIVSMMFIVMHHLIINGFGWTDMVSTGIQNNLVLCIYGGLVEPFVIIGVNLFFIVSGYFQIRFKWKKWFNLLFTLYIYMIIIQLFGVMVGYQELDFEIVKRMVLPFELYWYLKVYMVLLIISPILNLVVEHANKTIAKYFLLIFIVIFCTYTFLDNSKYLGVGRGYSLISACCLYLLGAFIQRGLLFESHFLTKKRCLIIYLFAALVNTLGIQFAINLLHSGKLAGVLLVYNNPLVAIESIFLFLFFAKLQIKNVGRSGRIMRYLGQNTLAVYILHSSNRVLDYFRNLPLQFLIANNHEIIAYILIIPYTILVFGVCILVNNIFQRLFGKVIDVVACKVGEKVEYMQNKLISWF